MSRHERRSQIARFRRETAGSYLMTYLTDDLSLVDSEPVLKAALAHWLSVVETRRPICIACRASFMDEGVEPSCWLFAISPNIPGAASTSALCQCWQTLPMDEIEAICTRLLRRLLPNGHFEDAA